MGNKDSKSKGGPQEVNFDFDEITADTIDKFFADAKKSGTLKNIERLDLSQKELSEIPNQIVKLPNLKILHLYDNNLKDIPGFIGICSHSISLIACLFYFVSEYCLSISYKLELMLFVVICLELECFLDFLPFLLSLALLIFVTYVFFR